MEDLSHVNSMSASERIFGNENKKTLSPSLPPTLERKLKPMPTSSYPAAAQRISPLFMPNGSSTGLLLPLEIFSSVLYKNNFIPPSFLFVVTP